MYIKTFLSFLIILSVLSCGKITQQFSSSDEKTNEKDKPETTTENSETTDGGVTEENTGESTGSEGDGIGGITYNVKDIPDGATYKGRIVASAEWEDKNGRNIVLVTETDFTPGKDDGQNKELYGYHYIADANTTRLWQINDFIKDCPVDVTVEYIPSSLTITDLNENGIAESTFLYKLSCKGDVSPDDLKLMMHEGGTKYAIRGETLVKYPVDGKTYEEGGKGTPDASFKDAPSGFLEYAREQWEKYKTVQY